jgi:hypothetical protein
LIDKSFIALEDDAGSPTGVLVTIRDFVTSKLGKDQVSRAAHAEWHEWLVERISQGCDGPDAADWPSGNVAVLEWGVSGGAA